MDIVILSPQQSKPDIHNCKRRDNRFQKNFGVPRFARRRQVPKHPQPEKERVAQGIFTRADALSPPLATLVDQ